MKIFQWIKYYWMLLRKKVEKFPITSTNIYPLLIKKLRVKKPDDIIHGAECTDRLYMACDYETIKKVAKMIPTYLQAYKEEEHDCDNFAKEFWGIASKLFPRLPIGYCHVDRKEGKHALNFMIYRTKGGRLDFTYIEPQSGRVSYYNYKPYLMII